MIKVQAIRESRQDSQPTREDYVLPEKEKGGFLPVAFVAFLAGFALYLKSFLPAARSEAVAEPKRPQAAESDQAPGGSEDVGATAAPREEAQPEEEAPANVVPITPRLSQLAVDSFLASDSPSLLFSTPKNGLALDPGPAANKGKATNDNERPPQQDQEPAPSARGGGGGGGDPNASGNDRTPPAAPRRPDAKQTGPDNRAPRTSGPVKLPDLIACQAYFIPVLALLAGASDADGDQLKVVELSAPSGTLAAVEGGWTFTPDRKMLGEVVFEYRISDGTESVGQLAVLRIVDAPPIVGTDGDDNLIGTACGDVVDGQDGDDNIDARQGDDVIVGGTGDDHIIAGEGDDVVYAGAGHDTVFAGPGKDVVFGGSGNDRLFGETGDDTIFGEAGDDLISGGDGDDVLLAGPGNDVVHGDSGNDMLAGDEGDDTLHGGEGADAVFAGSGDDAVFGGDGDDALSDGHGADTVDGGAGDDHVIAAADAASDSYEGGSGADTLDYSSATLQIVVDVGEATAEGLEIGRDLISSFEKIIGGRGNDHLVGGSTPISLTGGGGNDTFEFQRSDDDHQPDLVRKITDFTYGDRIIAASYEILYRDEDSLEEIGDLFDDIYLSQDEDNRPIRFRFEQLEGGDLTLVEVHDRADPEDFYSIELSGHHHLEFTVTVS